MNHKRIYYQWVNLKDATLRSFYSRKADDPAGPTVLFPMRKIETKDNCRDFVMDERVRLWRNRMAERFHLAPVFSSEEFWRVMCYELSANVWEHSGIPGFIGARVVEPYDAGKQEMSHHWQLTFDKVLDNEQAKWMKNGLLEIVVADGGTGLVKTLEQTFRAKHDLDESSSVSAEDVLCFALDELGTSKKRDDSWVTARHALSRILRIVGKYGGSLRLRSGDHEVVLLRLSRNWTFSLLDLV